LLAVLLAVVVSFAMAGGRLVAAESALDQAARAASRVASAQRDARAAEQQARRLAETTLGAQGLACDQLAVTVDVSAFAAPPGTTGLVRAVVRCTVRWSDLGLPGAPGDRTVESSFSSPIDRFRERVG
jgi:Flp pilus assembly protein TadG